MRRAGPGPTRGQLLLLLVVAVLAGTACATAAPTQTPLMQHGEVTVSAEAMRLRMRALAPSMIASVETAADDIRRSSDDPLVQRRAIVWKLNTATALYRQLFSEYPAAGLMDCWAMIIQVEQYLSTAEALRELGPARDAARAEMEKMEKRVEEWPAGPPRGAIRRSCGPSSFAGPVRTRWKEISRPGRAWWRTSPTAPRIQSSPPSNRWAWRRTTSLESWPGWTSSPPFSRSSPSGRRSWPTRTMAKRRYDRCCKRADLALDRVDRVLLWLGGPGLDGFAERQRIAMMAAVDRERLALTELVETEQDQLSEMIARERASVLEDGPQRAPRRDC